MATARASGLIKRFGDTVAVERVGLTLQAGEVRGLLGPNGAGKTTLLRMLFGLVRADEGTIELFGRVVSDVDGLALEGVAGFVEDPSFYPYLSGRANLELLVELDGASPSVPVERALERVALERRGDDRVAGYSSGMRQRLGIAAALLRAPRLLLLDEPTAGLDPAGSRFVGELLRELSADGVTVLLSSHQIAEIEEACDSFTVLNRGRVVWNGTAAEMRAQAPPSAYRLHTSDDRLALALADETGGIETASTRGEGFTLTAPEGELDRFVLALAARGVAVRRLELQRSSLESMFFSLTDSPGEPGADELTGSAETGGGR